MLGSNVPTVGGLPAGFKRADEWECAGIQVYLTQSRRWDVPDLIDVEVAEFKSAWQGSRVKVVVGHVPYLVNLASPRPELRHRSVSRLITEIDRAKRLGVPYLVLHPGSAPSRKMGIEFIIEGLDAALSSVDNQDVKVLLETVAGQGNMIGSRFEELSLIIENVERPECLGICFDTCHVFAAGYDIRGYDGYRRVLTIVDQVLGLDRIKAIHINDSKADLGARVDQHASIGEGFLGLQVFHAIVRDDIFSAVPKLLEVPERDKRSRENLELLRRLRAQEEPILERRRYATQLTLEMGMNEI